jgi:hypothetical protein
VVNRLACPWPASVRGRSVVFGMWLASLTAIRQMRRHLLIRMWLECPVEETDAPATISVPTAPIVWIKTFTLFVLSPGTENPAAEAGIDSSFAEVKRPTPRGPGHGVALSDPGDNRARKRHRSAASSDGAYHRT